MFEIKNLTLTNKDINTNKLTTTTDIYNYNIDFMISEDCIIGFYSKKDDVLTNVLLTLSGINKTSNIKNKHGIIYDNKNYFKERIYLDFKNQYLNTLRESETSKTLESLFNLKLDEKKFKQLVKHFKLHEKTTFTNIYKFTDEAKTLLNFCLLQSLNYKYAIINNPTININNIDYINDMIDAYKSNFEMCIFGINKITSFAKICEHIIVLDNFNNTRYLTPSSVLIVAIINDIKELEQYKMFENKKQNYVIYDELPKDMIKLLNKNKIEHHQIGILELEVYLWD